MRLGKVKARIASLFGGGEGERPLHWESDSDPAINRGCSEPEINKWKLSEFVVKRLYPIVGPVPFPLDELMLMASAVAWQRPTHIFEWGTNVGKSARIWYETVRYFGIDAEIHSVDLPAGVAHIEHPGEERGKLVRDIPAVALYEGDGVEVSLRIYHASGGGRPLFFLDGDHAFDSVRRELDAIRRECPEGWMLVHDTFYQSPESGYNIGPHRAVQEMLEASPGIYSVIATQAGLPGMTLLEPRS